jgi:hypothetical protein
MAFRAGRTLKLEGCGVNNATSADRATEREQNSRSIQHAQEPSLHGEAQLRHLVEEKRAPMRRLGGILQRSHVPLVVGILCLEVAYRHLDPRPVEQERDPLLAAQLGRLARGQPAQLEELGCQDERGFGGELRGRMPEAQE